MMFTHLIKKKKPTLVLLSVLVLILIIYFISKWNNAQSSTINNNTTSYYSQEECYIMNSSESLITTIYKDNSLLIDITNQKLVKFSSSTYKVQMRLTAIQNNKNEILNIYLNQYKSLENLEYIDLSLAKPFLYNASLSKIDFTKDFTLNIEISTYDISGNIIEKNSYDVKITQLERLVY